MDAVEDIKQRLSIEDVVSRYVELKRAGRNFKGLSPFSNEKTPSFMVSPEKQIWHDFSSGKGGNMFSFVMEMEGLDFKSALELLARQAGVDLSQYRGRPDGGRAKLKERLVEALELAAKFYQVQFSKHQPAWEYILKKRRFTKKTALEFRIGYSPSDGSKLTDFLLGRGFSEQEIKQAGLATQRYSGLGDMFRGRIMIPLMDPFGRIIGFTARLLNDEPNAPKYINTPQTPVYDKSRHVFGLHLAKEAIRKKGYSVVVEGNLDVIASHQAGVKQVVATAGTAMTEFHLKALTRFAEDVRLAFDQDSAGVNATERTVPIASKTGVNLSIIDVKDAKDPDELIQKSPKAWEQAVEQPVYAPDWLIERYKNQLDIKTAQGKKQFSDILLKMVSGLHDTVEQEHYLNRIAEVIAVNPEALRTKMAGSEKSQPKPLKKTPDKLKLDDAQVDFIKTQNHFLALMLMKPGLRGYARSIEERMLPEEQGQKLLVFLRDRPDFEMELDTAKVLQFGEYVKILVLLYEELYQSLEDVELQYEAARLQAKLVEQFVKTEKAKLTDTMQTAGETETEKLLEKAKELDILLKSVGETHA